jgi:hypothetical protein
MTNARRHLTVADVVSLADVMGRVTEAELEHGWQQLASRLGQVEGLESTTSFFAGRTRRHGSPCTGFRREIRPKSSARFRAFR